MSGHTPGPWTVEERDGLVIFAGTRPIARVLSFGLRPADAAQVMAANARLIKEAPALLEACEGLIAAIAQGQALPGADGSMSLPLQRALEATAKARGGTP